MKKGDFNQEKNVNWLEKKSKKLSVSAVMKERNIL